MTPQPKLRLALFDCDGTLVDGQASICTSMERAFAEAGRAAPARAEIRRIVGLSLLEAMRMLAPDDGEDFHRELVERYRLAFFAMRQAGQVDEPLFDGIVDVLDTLEAAGWLLGVATGKSRRGLDHVISVHGLQGRFVTLQTADRHPSKPHPAMVEAALAETGATAVDCVVIGDTGFDMAMAANAGARGIGVAWGYHAPAELLAAGAGAVAQSPAELIALMEAS